MVRREEKVSKSFISIKLNQHSYPVLNLDNCAIKQCIETYLIRNRIKVVYSHSHIN